jgi:hypothetical protein
MPTESSVTKFERVVRGRSLIILAATEVVLFVIANIAYGAGNQHGLRNGVSNVVWVLFLVGFLLLIVMGIAFLAQVIIRRRVKAQA